MILLLSKAKGLISGIIPAIGIALALFVGLWAKGVSNQKKRNDIEAIDLSFKKINLDNQSKPVVDLVAESNKSHGVNGGDSVVKKPGNGSQDG